ncbi:hypothetical protein IW146_005151 [Coemansia sp. RSA 922]|nr:hypothetical protein H4S03_006557 [Coemansia sp. S3946]KAJ2111717.1 hypothetical protein IW146_005151 [Coemansia sp. RSA 922]
MPAYFLHSTPSRISPPTAPVGPMLLLTAPVPAAPELAEDEVIDLATLPVVEPTLSDVQSFASFIAYNPKSVTIVFPTSATIIQPGVITYVDTEASTTLYIELNGVYNGEWNEACEAKYYSQDDASVETNELLDIIDKLTWLEGIMYVGVDGFY